MSEMKRTMFTGLFALMISFVFVSGVMAQQKPTVTPAPAAQQSKLEKFSGKVEKVDGTAKDVLVQFHKEKLTFSTGEHTKIMEGKKELSFSDLKKGMWASVEYNKEGNKLVAQSIQVSPPKIEKRVGSEQTTQKQVTPSEKTTEKK
jgi:Cu/Ag efflux protein CusF